MILSSGWFSSRHTHNALAGLLAWVAPWLDPADVAILHGTLRKAAHLAEYAILALLWFRALTRDTALRHGTAAGAALAICVAWAALDEVHQSFVPSRTASPGDVAIDAAGAMAALVVIRRDWLHTASVVTSLLLWVAAAGGAAVLAVDWATGVPPGSLRWTVPAAALALAARRWWSRRAAGAARAVTPSGVDRACPEDHRRRD